jgi:hypothetical protein
MAKKHGDAGFGDFPKASEGPLPPAEPGKGDGGEVHQPAPGTVDPPPQQQPKDPAGEDPRRLRPQRAPDPDKGDLPAAEPKDLTREAAGEFGTPPPGYPPPSERGPDGRTLAQTGLPRLINPSDRADTNTQTRYKIRADIPGETQPTWYIMAEKDDEDSARELYLRETGLQAKLDRANKTREHAVEKLPPVLPPELVITKLPD